MRVQGLLQNPLVAVTLALISICSIQAGAALAKGLFSLVTPEGMTALRLFFASLILFAVVRPRPGRVPRAAWKNILVYGLATGLMNMLFYQAISRIPLGVAVGVEFIGPLAVATMTSRRITDFIGIALAGIGLALLLPIGSVAGVSFTGVLFALGAGTCWGVYIIFGRRAGHDGGRESVPFGMLFAACLVMPVGILVEGGGLLRPEILPAAALVGLLSSALPYGLEMIVLQALPPRVFGVLMSLEPALACLSGWLFLREQLDLVHGIALACVITASVLVTLGARR